MLALERLVFDAPDLMARHPPVLRHPNKRVVFEIACPPGSVASGSLTYTRWDAMPLPASVDLAHAAARVEIHEGFYDYAAGPGPSTSVPWHVNFADPNLFVAYGSGLFAQDEMQVAEHPALGSLREALLATGHRALTVERGRPTPVLVTGVERRCRIETAESGLYGNAFARATPAAVRRATTPITPPTITNLIAMAAPSGGSGPYTAAQIELVLITAFIGFRAAVLESHRLTANAPVTVHSGFWGCGAFGGNRVLMSALQILAAEMAGLDRLVLHAADRAGAGAVAAAQELVTRRLLDRETMGTPELIERLVALGLKWGVSDGN